MSKSKSINIGMSDNSLVCRQAAGLLPLRGSKPQEGPRAARTAGQTKSGNNSHNPNDLIIQKYIDITTYKKTLLYSIIPSLITKLSSTTSHTSTTDPRYYVIH
jgi:hypothetical protein